MQKSVLLSVCLAILLQLPHEPEVKLVFPPRKTGQPQQTLAIRGKGWSRQTVSFMSSSLERNRSRCEAWLYLPSKAAKEPPVIVMAPGLGLQKDFELPRFAQAFAAAGYAAFLFDFAHFGESQGLPRHHVAPELQLQNYVDAVKHIQATGGLDGTVDVSRTVLWGASYSGGHALAAAAQLKQVAAVIAMGPCVGQGILSNRSLQLKAANGSAAEDTAAGVGLMACLKSLQSLLGTKVLTLRHLVVAAVDTVRSWIGLYPAYIPMIAADMKDLLQPLGLLRVPLSDYNDLMRAVQSTQGMGHWHNLVPAKVFWWYSKKDPLERAKSIKAPVLLITGRGHTDALAPEWAVREAGKRIGDLATTITLDGSHVSLYNNKELIPVMLMFLEAQIR